MKKMFLGAAAALLIAGSVAAQSMMKKESYILSVGANRSMPGTAGVDGSFGVMAAGAMNWWVNKSFSVQPELQYNQTRVKVGTASSSANGLSIPVLGVWSFPAQGTMTWMVEAGPQYDYTLETVGTGVKKGVFAGAAGIANEMKHGAQTWTVDLRYAMQMQARATGAKKDGSIAVSLGLKM